MHDSDISRRTVLRTSGAALAAATGVGAAGGVAAKNDNGKQFGRVWANDTLWRTNVVNVLDDEPDPSDRIYFVNDGTPASLPPGETAVNGGGSPFVSESAPGDRDWNGGQWVHYSAQLPEGETLNEPLTSEADVQAAADAGTLTISKGRPDIAGAPPNFFVCPLNGRA